MEILRNHTAYFIFGMASSKMTDEKHRKKPNFKSLMSQ